MAPLVLAAVVLVFTLSVCTSGVDDCKKDLCVVKCCPEGSGIISSNKTEDATGDSDNETGNSSDETVDSDNETGFFCDKTDKVFRAPVDENTDFGIVVAKTDSLHCSSDSIPLNISAFFGIESVVYVIKTDRRLYINNDNKSYEYLCVDNFIGPGMSGLLCYPQPLTPTRTESNSAGQFYFTICELISCFFSALTLAAYARLPFLRKLDHAPTFMATVLCNLVGFLSAAVNYFLTFYGLIEESAFASVAMILITYFFLLSMYFWLNVMSYDFWSRQRRSNPRVKTSRQFRWYCVYAFGSPAVLTILMAALCFSNLPDDDIFKPKLKTGGSFVRGFTRHFYFDLPILLIWVTNTIFFVSLVDKIFQDKRETKRKLNTGESRIHKKQKNSFLLYLKLYVVMGISWIFEVVSACCNEYASTENYVWILFDLYNMLIGVVIFILFICKKEVLRKMQKRNQFELSNSITNSQRRNSSRTTSQRTNSQRPNSQRTNSQRTTP